MRTIIVFFTFPGETKENLGVLFNWRVASDNGDGGDDDYYVTGDDNHEDD